MTVLSSGPEISDKLQLDLMMAIISNYGLNHHLATISNHLFRQESLTDAKSGSKSFLHLTSHPQMEVHAKKLLACTLQKYQGQEAKGIILD